jgi:hypothetical protein
MINSGSKSSPPFDVGMMSSTVTPCAAGGLRASGTRCRSRTCGSGLGRALNAQAGAEMVQSQFRRRAADCSPERRRMWSDISMSRHRRLRDKPRSRSEVARSPRLLGAVACSDITSPVVTSTHRILHSLEAKFDEDRQAENLRAAQSRCRPTAVRCSRGLRAFRARLSGPTD